jgi:hypothetical protein
MVNNINHPPIQPQYYPTPSLITSEYPLNSPHFLAEKEYIEALCCLDDHIEEDANEPKLIKTNERIPKVFNIVQSGTKAKRRRNSFSIKLHKPTHSHQKDVLLKNNVFVDDDDVLALEELFNHDVTRLEELLNFTDEALLDVN